MMFQSWSLQKRNITDYQWFSGHLLCQLPKSP